MTEGMISVSTARLSWVLEWLRRWTRTTMPYQIAFCAVWLMAWASHKSKKLRLLPMDVSPTAWGVRLGGGTGSRTAAANTTEREPSDTWRRTGKIQAPPRDG